MSDPTEFSPPPPTSTDLPPGWLEVTAMDMDAQGVARKPDGKVVFIDGALPTELVSANTHRKKNNWEQASLTEVHRQSSQRVQPG
ncbi:MAG: 23S rRNA (uracil(1939)-C(5))-methyltransferase, partial [Diaphorobacter nitroreducens]